MFKEACKKNGAVGPRLGCASGCLGAGCVPLERAALCKRGLEVPLLELKRHAPPPMLPTPPHDRRVRHLLADG